MKKVVMLLAVTMLLFGFGSQAMAAFTAGDLIQVVYTKTGNEVITDLGNISTWTTAGSVSSQTFSAPSVSLSQFSGSSWSDLNVAYFTFTGQSSQANFWMSGPQAGQTNTAGLKPAVKSAMNSTMQLAASDANGTAQASYSALTTNSYYTSLDKTGLSVGTMAAFITTGNAEANLANIANGVDLWLYYYPTATSNAAGTGAQLAKLTISLNGAGTQTKVAAATTPVPPSVLLLGSGLLGLVGIRRKMTV